MNGLEKLTQNIEDLGGAFKEYKAKAEGKLKHAVEDARRAREIAERILTAMKRPMAGDGSSSTTGKLYSSQESEHHRVMGDYLLKGVEHEFKDLGSLSDPAWRRASPLPLPPRRRRRARRQTAFRLPVQGPQ